MTSDQRRCRAPRLIGLLGGTTTAGDCVSALRFLVRPQNLVDGPAIAEFERAFAEEIGVGHAVSFATGRVGLYGLLLALGIGRGDDVMLQVPTHIVVANAIRHTGARPLYVDCDETSYNLDLSQARRRITSRTRALVLQHTFGLPAELDEIVSFTAQHDLLLIEDCVHSLGSSYEGRPLGGFGRAAVFSTEETKTISTTMGGMVVTDDETLAFELRRYQRRCAPPAESLAARYVLKLILYHLLTEPTLHRYTRRLYTALGRRQPFPGPTVEAERRGLWASGLEQRLSNVQAALGLRQLRRLEENIGHRREIAAECEKELARYGFETLPVTGQAEPALLRYPLRVADRERAVRATASRVVLGTWFTSVLEEAESPEAGDYVDGSCPRAEAAADHLVNLPTHPRMTADDVSVIIRAIADAEGRAPLA